MLKGLLVTDFTALTALLGQSMLPMLAEPAKARPIDWAFLGIQALAIFVAYRVGMARCKRKDKDG